MRSFSDYDVLNLSQFPRLHSLVLRARGNLPSSLKDTAQFLSCNNSFQTLRTLTLVLDNMFDFINPRSSSKENIAQIEAFSEEHSRACCRDIDHILSAGQHDRDIAITLTVKATQGLPRHIITRLEHEVQAAFPELHRRGALKTQFSIRSKSKRSFIE